MSPTHESHWIGKRQRVTIPVAFLLFLTVPVSWRAQQKKSLDKYKVRVEGDWWLSHSTGYSGAQGSDNRIQRNQHCCFGLAVYRE